MAEGQDRIDLIEDRSPVDALVRSDRVHASVYTDANIFDAEMERIFHRTWVYVGHESEIPETGDFVTRRIGKQPVIFVRDSKGQVRVIMNRCRHRGALLCTENSGNAPRFFCPYHGWTYRNSGELVGFPMGKRYPSDLSPADMGLISAPRVSEYRGFYFASLSPEGPSLDERLGDLAKREIDIAIDLSPVGSIRVSAGTHKYGYDGNWKLQVENSLDAYHLGYLHKSYMDIVRARTGLTGNGVNMGSDDSPAVIKSLGNGHVCWDTSPLNLSLTFIGSDRSDGAARQTSDWQDEYKAALLQKHGPDHARYLSSRSGPHVLIFPNLVLISSQVRIIQPVAVDRTEVHLMPVLLDGVPPELNQQRLRGHEGFYGPSGGGATDDMVIFERQMEGFRATVDPWIHLSRGLDMETVGKDGAIVGQITDELGSRAVLAEWKRLMAAPPATV